MDEFLSAKNSLAGILVIGTGFFLLQIVKLIIPIFKKESDVEKTTLMNNTSAINALTCSMDKMREQLVEIPKIKTYMKRSFAAHRISFGDRWPLVGKQIIEEENING